ncbi:MAG TPA: DUF1801 domain-containing protein [Thermoanaerobaculia bacterium]|nr:DUF1801 domain-containing protein [Thermoanaerobaculia bacterium]
MARSAAKTVDEYLAELPDDRREAVTEVRKLIRKHLPKGYEETVNWGMLCYQIPLAKYPDTYNGQPLGYVALASQKNYCALYLMTPYMDPAQGEELKEAFARAGKKMDMGKSCLRFKTADDLPLPALGKIIASTPPAEYIAMHEAVHPPKAKKKPASKSKKK